MSTERRYRVIDQLNNREHRFDNKEDAEKVAFAIERQTKVSTKVTDLAAAAPLDPPSSSKMADLLWQAFEDGKRVERDEMPLQTHAAAVAQAELLLKEAVAKELVTIQEANIDNGINFHFSQMPDNNNNHWYTIKQYVEIRLKQLRRQR